MEFAICKLSLSFSEQVKTRRGRAAQIHFTNMNEEKFDAKFGRWFVGEYRSNWRTSAKMKERERKIIKNCSLKNLYNELMETAIKLNKIIKRNSALETEINIMEDS